MQKNTCSLSVLALAVFGFSGVLPARDLAPAFENLPQSAAIVLEIARPGLLFEPVLGSDLAGFSQALAGQEPNPKLAQFRAVIAYLEAQLSTDWRNGVRQLAGRGVTFTVHPDGGTCLVIDGRDEKLLTRLHEILRQFAADDAAKQGAPERVAMTEYKGTNTWSFGPNEAHMLLGPRLVVANRQSVLERMLDQKAGDQGSLATSTRFQAARKAVGTEAAALIYFDLGALGQIPGVKKALADDGNAAGMLLLADTKAALREATWVALGVYVRGGKLCVRSFTDGRAPEPAKCASFAPERGPEAGILPILEVPDEIASFSLCRDLRTFYAAKDELFPERTSGLVFFENMMGIFFSGIDLTEGVLAELKPDIRIVVAAQNYDPAAGRPAVQVPAFAAVFRLRHPQSFGETIEEAWQKALGLVNFTRGQKALPGLVIDRASHADVKYTVSYYRPPEDKDKAPPEDRYNYRPSLARPGDYVVLSSTDGLARDLIDALKRESANPPGLSQAAHTSGAIHGGQLRQILSVNREHLIRKNMVEKGNSRAQADQQIATFLALIDCVDRATWTMSREDGRPSLAMEFDLKVPAAKRAD